MKFPVDAPKKKVIKALRKLGFAVINEREHIGMIRTNKDGSKTPLTLIYKRINSSNNLYPKQYIQRRISRCLL